MPSEIGDEEDRPVSIASLRSRFENLAAGNTAETRSVSRPRSFVGAAATVKSNGNGVGSSDLRVEKKMEEMKGAKLDGSAECNTEPVVLDKELSGNLISTPASTTAEPEVPVAKPRLKPPAVAPKPPSLASRPSPPALSRSGVTPTSSYSSRPENSSEVASDQPASSVKAMLARYSNSPLPGATNPTANTVAGPSHAVPRKAVPANINSESSHSRSPSAVPSLRRTSVEGKSTVSIPLSPPDDRLREPDQVPSPRLSPALPPPQSNRSLSPTPPVLSRAPSPKPPEPSRASKPVRNAPPASTEIPSISHSSPSPPITTTPAPPPSLPSRKAAAPPPSITGPPPIPANRPRLASAVTAVMAAQAISAPPRMPTRNRAETVGTRDLPPPPSRSLPVKSATALPTLSPRKNRGPSISAPLSNPDEILDSPTEEYQPPPPPTRHILPTSQPLPPRRTELRVPEIPLEADSEDDDDVDGPNQTPGLTTAAKRALDDSPDSTHANRRPPKFTPDMKITGTAHTSSFAMHGRYVCTGSHVVRIYDTQLSDQPIHYIDLHQTGLEFRIKDPKITAMCFRPAAFASEEGRYLWCGTKDGHLFELDIKTGEITDTRPALHSSSVVDIFRYKKSIMTLEEAGKLHVFTVGQRLDGTEEIAKIPQLCRTVRITEKFNFAKLICGRLWTSTGPASRSTTSTAAAKGPTIRVYDPCTPSAAQGGKTVWATEWTGAVTCATILPLHPDRVYLGHEGGYVSLWDAEDLICRQVLKISSSDILSLEGVGERLWAGNRKGQIHAYDVTTRPWRTTNLWTAHPEHSVHHLAVDPWSIEQTGRFVLWSLGKDSLRAWDGLLSVDWIARQADYSQFRNISTLVCSWNIDSAKPTELSGSDANVNFLPDLLHSVDKPEIIAFGFQEVIPLTDKKLTAKTLLFGKSRDSGSPSDKVSQAYRLWLDKLSSSVRQAYPETSYVKVHSESLVGLFTCVFVKASERDYLRDVDVCTVKRGIGGIYGNKGAIIARLVIDDTSICFINVHLAAGQSAKAARTVDLGVIMEDKSILPVTDSLPFINGGDGTAVLDHELVILNGDLNYRIDQRRENVLSSIHAGELQYLLEHDQLRKEMQSNHAFRLRSFDEAPIHFKPTYKYNSGTSDYDSSEKRRIPAWCDRILFNKTPRLQSLHYRRYEPTVSDHKPIAAAFRMQVKAVDQGLMEVVRKEVSVEWSKREAEMLGKMEAAYLELG